MDPKPQKPEKRTYDLPRTSLYPLTLEAALRRALNAPVEPKQPTPPRKKPAKG
jgi:hypothetical protein